MKYLFFIFFGLLGYFSYASELKPHTLTYQVFKDDINLGEETRILQRMGDTYTYETFAHTSGLVKLFFDYQLAVTTTFSLTPELTPVKYQIVEQKNGTTTKDFSLLFEKGRVTRGEKEWSSSGRILDILSVFLALGQDYQANRELSYMVIDGKKLTVQLFVVKENTKLDIMVNGKQQSLPVVILTNNDDIEVFISPKYHYVPLRITKKSWEYQLTRIDF